MKHHYQGLGQLVNVLVVDLFPQYAHVGLGIQYMRGCTQYGHVRGVCVKVHLCVWSVVVERTL